MPNFDFQTIRSVEFGVCLETADGESYRLMPCSSEVQAALKEMLHTTWGELFNTDEPIREFSPAEKYGPTERLSLPLSSELAQKHLELFRTSNLPSDSNALNEMDRLISYFAIFRDARGNKLMAFRRAMQFKGVLRKKLIRFSNDSLQMIHEDVFKLDVDFDFLIFDGQIVILRPSGFIFTSDMDGQLAASAIANIDSISEAIDCIDFSRLRDFVSSHKLAMRLVAAIKSRNDLSAISLRRLRAECKESGIAINLENRKVSPANGNEMAFLMLLDRRRYTVTLIERQPETYEAPSRYSASRAEAN